MARRTYFREEYYTGMRDINEAGKIAGPNPRKLYIKMWWFFIDISGLINSFGLALCVGLEYVVVLQWIATGHPGKSI